jgi:hypothetical protein
LNYGQVGDAPTADRALWNAVTVRVEGKT